MKWKQIHITRRRRKPDDVNTYQKQQNYRVFFFSLSAPDAVDVVTAGIEMVHNLTCVRFAPFGSQLANSVSHSNYIYFFSQS